MFIIIYHNSLSIKMAGSLALVSSNGHSFVMLLVCKISERKRKVSSIISLDGLVLQCHTTLHVIIDDLGCVILSLVEVLEHFLTQSVVQKM